MALTQSMSPLTRQPFGVIDSSRMRFLQSMKNQQNGMSKELYLPTQNIDIDIDAYTNFALAAAPPSTSLKRRLDTSDLSNTETIDPSSFSFGPLGSKRARNHLVQDVSKPPKFTIASPRTVTSFATSTTNARCLQTPVSKIKLATLPNSAPLRAPAGRSPKSKSKPVKAFSRRSTISCSSTYTRIDPPTLFAKPHAPRAPFSIADALHGTRNTALKTTKAARPSNVNTNNNSNAIDKPRPMGWDFEIYVDTEQDEMANLMQHSTCVLDISDDEDKPRTKDERGKENIPPAEMIGAAPTTEMGSGRNSRSRTLIMTDELQGQMQAQPRAVLGELDVALFISEEDVRESERMEKEQEQEQEQELKNENENENINLDTAYIAAEHSPLSEHSIGQSQVSNHHHYQHEPQQHQYQHQHQPSNSQLASHAAISALIFDTADGVDASSAFKAEGPTNVKIEIWESESAAGEAEAEV
ncbi:hypothetical protein PAAG_07269 [Paracoccidioides lutzii Pb01]|uniref:Uncharacterized protein n=1 Tax=Paracoccidioides lutzii (strain ATCC MYA-826 / Pb01) TaxID=502779 RepID=C1H928_PARBA|nr:hypothetical protein PAAG_07269 [Paracoccidioides lutzii Pb01]EEH36851.2 hypothetical protein PAAG_07269 [Paracoccidioides lutzii Pb01]